MEENEKTEGELVFDIGTGTFWITKDDLAVDQIQFGDEFEVWTKDGWIKTGIEISDDGNGNLLFKLKNTDLQGILDGTRVRR